MLKSQTSFIAAFILCCTSLSGSPISSDQYVARAEKASHKPKHQRPYWTSTSPEQSDSIRFIILTLGNESLLKIKKMEPELTRNAANFEKVHPLNVWRVIFSSSDTISALQNIKNRKLIWKKFMKGMGESLQEAQDMKDLKDEFIHDFSNKLSIQESESKRLLNSSNWIGFVDYLISEFNTVDGTDRYNQ